MLRGQLQGPRVRLTEGKGTRSCEQLCEHLSLEPGRGPREAVNPREARPRRGQQAGAGRRSVSKQGLSSGWWNNRISTAA